MSDKTIFKIHRWLGLIGGIFFLLQAITGSILLFDHEIDNSLNAKLLHVEATGTRQPYKALVELLKKEYPDRQLAQITLNANEPTHAVFAEVREGRKGTWIHWNPYTNQITGTRTRQEVFVKTVLQFHEHLTLGDTGHAIMLLVGLCLLGSALSGIWYYRKAWKSVFSIGVRNKTSLLLNADLHKLLGVSSLLFLLLMAATGTFMNWEKVERMLGEVPRPPGPPKGMVLFLAKDINFDTDSLIAQAAKTLPDFTPMQVFFPKEVGGDVSVSGTRPQSNRLLGVFNSAVQFNMATGKATVSHKEDEDLEFKMEQMNEQLHFGKYGGLFTKIIYLLGAWALLTLTVTGVWLWYKKR